MQCRPRGGTFALQRPEAGLPLCEWSNLNLDEVPLLSRHHCHSSRGITVALQLAPSVMPRDPEARRESVGRCFVTKCSDIWLKYLCSYFDFCGGKSKVVVR